MPDTALVVVDMQEYYLNPGSDFYCFAESRQPGCMQYISERANQVVIPHIKKLIEYFRKKKTPIIYLKLCGNKPDRSDLHRFFAKEYQRGCLKGFSATYPLVNDSMSKVIASLEPQTGDWIYNKTTFSAFHSTSIEQDLKAKKIKQLVFTGLATSQCVETTARDASDCGFRVIHVEDAQADYTETSHRVSLYSSAAVCGGWVFETQAILQEWDEINAQIQKEEK